MSEPRESDEDFPSRWLREQRAFWNGWRERPPSGEAYEAAEEFWEQSCQRWWEQVRDSLPAPLGTQVRAALQQTRMYLSLARGLATCGPDDGPTPTVSGALEKIFEASLAAGPGLDESSASSTPALDPTERRYMAAYSALAARLSEIATEALEQARDRIVGCAHPDPASYYDLLCQEVETRYREHAGRDDFARALGELVNARVGTLSPDGPSGNGPPGQ